MTGKRLARDDEQGAGMYRVHCERCDMHTGKMPPEMAAKAAGAHTVSTGHNVSAEAVGETNE